MSIVTYTTEEIAAACKALVIAGKSMSRKVETILVMAVYDSIVNKSPMAANSLLGSLRKSTKQQGIVAFLEKFGQLYKRGDKFVHFALGAQEQLVWDADYVAIVQEEAQSWEDFKPPVVVAEVDCIKMVEAVIKKAEKAQENDAPVVDAALVPYLKAIIAQYTAKKALEAAAATAKASPVVSIVPVAEAA